MTRHIHVYDSKRRPIGRLDLERMVGLEGWITWDNGQVAEVSSAFIRELLPKK